MPLLNLPDCGNARDLGGLPLSDGTAIRPNALLRTDNLDQLTPAGIAAVRGLGVSRVLDLRFAWEARKYPGPFVDDPIYLNLPLVGERGDYDPEAPADYRPELDRFGDLIATAVGALADAPEGPVLVHCHAGRDRTGMLVALALGIAGAAPATIVADYAASDGAEAATMAAMLDHLDRGHGGVTGYLRAAGVGEARLLAIRNRLRGPAPG